MSLALFFLLACLSPVTLYAIVTPQQLSDNTTCHSLNINPDRYRARITLPDTYNTSTSYTVFMPLFSSHPLDQPFPTLHTAVVFLHGLSGDANSYFCQALATVTASGLSLDSILVITPWFGNEQVTGPDWDGKGDSNEISAYWDVSRWLDGGNNSPSPLKFTTSFDVFDNLAATLLSASSFPSLSLLTFTGFSAGAQLVSRYAFFTPYGGKLAPVTRVPIRFLPADGSSYLYLDPSRPTAACTPLRDTGVTWTCHAFTTPDKSACSDYDDYKYGLNMENLSANLYVDAFSNDQLQAAVRAFPSKDIRFFLGRDDVCNCNVDGFSLPDSCRHPPLSCSPDSSGGASCCDTWPDSLTANDLDVHCAAMLQGSNRLQRGLNYVSYLKQRFPEWTVQYGVFNGSHSNAALYADPSFRKAVFQL
eukprot:TRINITY_DN1678_c0_g1_i1.p1 TRINITY_DN1678_c0_g1~~TRINITY_DN1678_c0_g1_i1.p1  ORF type:complete len:419 (+),score=61.36 TRINITY_DN1678_c0_g1_i1:75-1331(+)